MTDRLSVKTPAKLNLVLNISGRREDGYHLLETAFQFIDLCDRLEFVVEDGGGILRAPSRTPVAAEDDLLMLAARRLQTRYRVERGVRIGVDKRIPVGAGLGGGSSDAAACLLALNRLWELNLTTADLADIGLELGADLPVFIHGRAAWATGIGEVLEPLDLDEPYYLVIDPGIAVSTVEIFAAAELTRTNDPLTIRAFLQGAGTNVCEPVVRRRYPQVAAALDWLGQHARARMTGTGACVFAAIDSLTQAEKVKSRVPEQWTAYVAKAMNRNPVHRQLELSV